MVEQLQQLLQHSAKLYEHLSTVPKGEDRDTYIEQINSLLDERGLLLEKLIAAGFIFNAKDTMHATLAELDSGIKSRLNNVFTNIKGDLKNIQNSKKNETQYMNPYSDVRVMDGMYYDKKN